MTNFLQKFSLWLSIAVGLLALTLSIRGSLGASWQAALGVFFIFIGLNGFLSLRIKKVEEMIKEMKEKNAK
jgi:hypothetical protein